MAVESVLRKGGQWSVQLRPDTPPGLIGSLEWFGHVVIVPGHLNPVERGDELLDAARHVGVLRTITAADGQTTLAGVGLEAWLGDDDGKGVVIEYPGVTLSGATFAASISALLPAAPFDAIKPGTLYTGVPGTYGGTHQYQTPRTAIDYVCDTMGGEWRITNRARLDAGPAASLFVTTPTTVIVRKGAGYDATLKAIPGSVDATRDAKDYTTRVVLVAAALAGGTADAPSVPYKDLHGNTVKITRVIDEQDDTLIANAPARAAAALTASNVVRNAIRLSAREFDISGDFRAGDAVWVYDPDGGVFDTANEVTFRGGLIYPRKVRVLSLTWPVEAGYTVAYRNGLGQWTDLTPWVAWEPAGGGEVEVADTTTSPLTPGVGSIGTQVAGGGGGMGDTAIPGVPTFGAFTTASYQPQDGLPRATVTIPWTQPTNTDSSTIVDGDHYEIQYRPTGTANWDCVTVPWDQTSTTVTNLPPATGHDWRIRAVDYATPVNYGAWSGVTAFTTAQDTTAPATPAAASVAASRIAVQVTHTLGLASGGIYNLPLDLDHLEVHGGATSGFTPDATTRLGKVAANAGMITGSIPAVSTFNVESVAAVHIKVIAVDRTGNKSPASAAASATALLIDTAHISDLTVSKLTAGTMTAAVILGGSIKTATSGARTESDSAGIRLYNSSGAVTVDLSTATGTGMFTGTVQTGLTGSRIIIDPATTTVFLLPSTGSAAATITGLGVDLDGNGPAAALAWLNARSSAGTGGSYANLVLGSYNTGSYRSRAFMTARQGDGQTSAWLDLVDYTSDATKQAVLGVGSESGAVMSRVACVGSGATMQGYTSGAPLARFWADGAGAVRMESLGGSNYALVGITGGPFMQLSTPGGVGQVLLSRTSSYLWMHTDQVDLAAETQLNLYGSTIYIGSPSGDNVRSDAIYNNTSTFTANVGIATTPIGRLYRLTSSARYKVAITETDTEPGLSVAALHDLSPVAYFDRGQSEASGGTSGLSRQLGLIAEQVAVVPGWGDLLVERDDDGDPESVNYDRVGVAALAWLRDVENRLRAVEGGAALKAPPRVPAKVRALSKSARKILIPTDHARTEPTTRARG